MHKEVSMTAASFFNPHYIENPYTIYDKFYNFIEGYFDLTNASAIETALKVISYATLIIPAAMLLAKAFLRCCAPLPIATIQVPQIPGVPLEIQEVLDQTLAFEGYFIGQGTPYEGTNLTAATVRPANLLYGAMRLRGWALGGETMPGSGELFTFLDPHSQIRNRIFEDNPDDVLDVSARWADGRIGNMRINMTDLYGDQICRISCGEIQEILNSQKIYTAPLLPLPFYRALKQAMREDHIVTLPGNDAHPVKLSALQNPHCRQLIDGVRNHFADYGFSCREACEELLDLTLYQLGSLVVKTENYLLLVDANGKIRERHPGEADMIRLINACGIRGIHATPPTEIDNRMIMGQAFRTALIAAENGFVAFPAVGMGIWGGDPNLYWRAFLDAVIQAGAPLEKIFVNPRHQITPRGPYTGQNGGEFQTILNEYRTQYANNAQALANLDKIINLYERQTDVLQLSQQLKRAYPDRIVSLFNASDPDVTLGNHVGEYVNNLNHANTTEENYTALGTNGLCFEGITGVHEDERRLIQT